MRLNGLFKALGRIIGHLFLHGASGPSGLSPAVKQHIYGGIVAAESPNVVIEDVPDFELRELISQVSQMLI